MANARLIRTSRHHVNLLCRNEIERILSPLTGFVRGGLQIPRMVMDRVRVGLRNEPENGDDSDHHAEKHGIWQYLSDFRMENITH